MRYQLTAMQLDGAPSFVATSDDLMQLRTIVMMMHNACKYTWTFAEHINGVYYQIDV